MRNISLERKRIRVEGNRMFCEGCVHGKQQRNNFGIRKNWPMCAGEKILADVCGPMQQRFIGEGGQNILSPVEEFSLLNTSENANCLNTFTNESEAAHERIKELRCGGKGFGNSEVHAILTLNRITPNIVTSYIPEQNGSAERENRKLVERARCLIRAKNLPARL